MKCDSFLWCTINCLQIRNTSRGRVNTRGYNKTAQNRLIDLAWLHTMKGCPTGVGCAKGGLNPVDCCMGGWLVALQPVWGNDVLDVGGACQFGPPVLLCGTGAVHWCCDLPDGPMMFPLQDNESTNHNENVKLIQHAWKCPYHSFPNIAVPAWKGIQIPIWWQQNWWLHGSVILYNLHKKPPYYFERIRCKWKPFDFKTLCDTFTFVKQWRNYRIH